MKTLIALFSFLTFTVFTCLADSHVNTPTSPASKKSSVQPQLLQNQSIEVETKSTTTIKPEQGLKQKTKVEKTFSSKKELKKYLRKVKKANKAKDDRPTHWANIVALITGIITFLFGYLALPALIFGAIGMSKSGKDKEFKGKGMGIVGLVAGILGLIIYFAVIAAVA